jgi:hypothetical protein
VVLIAMFALSQSVFACTDPKCKEKLHVKNDETLVYEYFQPAKIKSEKKHDVRPPSEIADSILSVAKVQFEMQNTDIASNDGHYRPIRVEAQTDMGFVRYKSDSIVIKTKMWADSICALFRRGKYELEGELLPH